jgi:FkbM family methyltransferase
VIGGGTALQKLSKGAAASRAAAEAMYFGMRQVPLLFWDIGARGGLSRPMEILYRVGVMRPSFFEPDPLEANTLTRRYKASSVFKCALSDKDGAATLYLTRDPACSSLLRPVNPLDIVRAETVPIARADTLLRTAQREHHPEILKIDVQGSELAVLDGFGRFLNSVICIESEVSFRKTYERQYLIESVTAFLMRNGFGLVDIRLFGVRATRAALQANAFFVRRELGSERQVAVERVFRTVNRISLAP